MMFKLAILSLYFLHTSLVQSEAANHPVDDDMSTSLSLRLLKKIEPTLKALNREPRNQTRVYGERRNDDSLLYTETVEKKIFPWHPLQFFKTDIIFPVNGTSNNKTINYISLRDNKANGESGYALVKIGTGVGFKNVIINCRGIWGFNYTAEIYGFDKINETLSSINNNIY